MKVEVDLTEYGVKAPKWYDPINPHVINASGGSGGGNDVELTWEEYEALSEEEKMNGSNYFITNIGNPKSLTKKVLFDSTMSLNTTYNLNDSFSNYDYISFYIHMDTDVVGRSNIFTYPQILEAINSSYKRIQVDTQHSSGVFYAAEIEVTNNTIKPTDNGNGTWPITRFNLKIVGYRYERVVVPNQMVNYSTVEQRIGIWIDGKPLYRRTYVLNTGIKNNYNYYLTDISDTELEIFFIDYNGSFYFYSPGGSIGVVPYNYSPNAASVCAEVAIDSSEHKIRLSWRTGADAVNQPLYITIQYTKTTD